MLEFLRREGINESILKRIEDFRSRYPVSPEMRQRVPRPRFYYYGTDIWDQALTALLAGENLLLVGPKATGKNVLAENLSAVFSRPAWDISFYLNTDAASLIGTDTFVAQEVRFREGPVYQCAVNGGFGVLDEINMAKNDAAAVLHATLDYRRMIDVPGYNRIFLHDATRFIATMNYGYAGTRELNEALVSRFMVIDMPDITEEILGRILMEEAVPCRAQVIGPVNEAVYKVHDYFRKSVYLKHSSYDILLNMKNRAEARFGEKFPEGVSVLCDFT